MTADLSLLSVLWLAAPEDEDVVAGPWGAAIFVGLVIAVAILGWSLNKHLKKASRAADEGVYGDPVEPADPIEPVEPADPVDPVDPVDPADPVETDRAGGER